MRHFHPPSCWINMTDHLAIPSWNCVIQPTCFAMRNISLSWIGWLTSTLMSGQDIWSSTPRSCLYMLCIHLQWSKYVYKINITNQPYWTCYFFFSWFKYYLIWCYHNAIGCLFIIDSIVTCCNLVNITTNHGQPDMIVVLGTENNGVHQVLEL